MIKNGNRDLITYPDSKVVSYEYDTVNRMAKVTDWNNSEVSYSYDDASRLIGMEYPNGIEMVRVHDAAGRISEHKYTKDNGTTTLISYDINYDSNGNPTDLNTYGLPDPSKLVSDTVTYNYDQAHQIENSSKGIYSHDQRGSMISRVVNGVLTNFTFGVHGMMTQQQTGAEIVTHTYDGNKNRIARQDSVSITRYVLDYTGAMSHLLCTTDNTGNITEYYLRGLENVAKYTNTGSLTYFYMSDPYGNIIALSDSGGNITDKYIYSPYGQVLGKVGTNDNKFLFCGSFGVINESDGLYFMRARYYDSLIGRFISEDPVEGDYINPVSLHKYLYAANNSLIYSDPSGKSVIWSLFSSMIETGLEYSDENFFQDSNAADYFKIANTSFGLVDDIISFSNIPNYVADKIAGEILSKTGSLIMEGWINSGEALGDVFIYSYEAGEKLADKVYDKFFEKTYSYTSNTINGKTQPNNYYAIDSVNMINNLSSPSKNSHIAYNSSSFGNNIPINQSVQNNIMLNNQHIQNNIPIIPPVIVPHTIRIIKSW